MTIKVNAMGDACPIPVVKTQKAMHWKLRVKMIL